MIFDYFKRLVLEEIDKIKIEKSAELFINKIHWIEEKREQLTNFLRECYSRTAPFAEETRAQEARFSLKMQEVHLNLVERTKMAILSKFYGKRHQLLSSVCDLYFLKNRANDKLIDERASVFIEQRYSVKQSMDSALEEIVEVILEDSKRFIAYKNEAASREERIMKLHVAISDEEGRLELVNKRVQAKRKPQKENQTALDEQLAIWERKRDVWRKKVNTLQRRSALQFVRPHVLKPRSEHSSP
ncbi:hypothetical protein L596_003970 [Steinernema carpocapsae]|uniref:Uncharacterized protein n=1 Tax=Steinernema carpocapsae TaxID=34508 RepID=A0A4V6I854_STECR|nr:hypothetical protein L596_003970 [Steinernema carpocapsae]